MVYLSVAGLKALGWTFLGIDVILTVGRLVLRWYSASLRDIGKSYRRFTIDDVFHVFALFGALTYVGLQSSGLDTFIRVEEFDGAHKGYVDLEDINTFYHIRFGAVLIFWLTIYSVKFSFLGLYQRLFWVSPVFRRAWCTIAIYTFTCFAASFMACFWVCGYPIAPTNLKRCMAKGNAKIQNNIEYVWCALNASSSLLILALPIGMLRKLKMNPWKKFGLACVFTLGALDIFFDIFRTFYTTTSIGVQNLWEILEVSIAVMLSALVAYPQAFTLRSRMASASTERNRLKGSESTSRFKSNTSYKTSHDSQQSLDRSHHNHPRDVYNQELEDIDHMDTGRGIKKESSYSFAVFTSPDTPSRSMV